MVDCRLHRCGGCITLCGMHSVLHRGVEYHIARKTHECGHLMPARLRPSLGHLGARIPIQCIHRT